MSGKIIQFPTREPPPQTEGMSLEDVVNIEFKDDSKAALAEFVAKVGFDPDGRCIKAELAARQADPPPFLDWVYVEVVDLQAYVAELCTVAEQQGEEAFWSLVKQIREQINSWAPPR